MNTVYRHKTENHLLIIEKETPQFIYPLFSQDVKNISEWYQDKYTIRMSKKSFQENYLPTAQAIDNYKIAGILY